MSDRHGDEVQEDAGLKEGHALEEALAIQRCLKSLAADARQRRMTELANFIDLAALAAEDTAKELRAKADPYAALMQREPAGRC